MKKIIKWLFYKYCVDQTPNKWRLYSESIDEVHASNSIFTESELIEEIITGKLIYCNETHELYRLRSGKQVWKNEVEELLCAE